MDTLKKAVKKAWESRLDYCAVAELTKIWKVSSVFPLALQRLLIRSLMFVKLHSPIPPDIQRVLDAQTPMKIGEATKLYALHIIYLITSCHPLLVQTSMFLFNFHPSVSSLYFAYYLPDYTPFLVMPLKLRFRWALEKRQAKFSVIPDSSTRCTITGTNYNCRWASNKA